QMGDPRVGSGVRFYRDHLQSNFATWVRQSRDALPVIGSSAAFTLNLGLLKLSSPQVLDRRLTGLVLLNPLLFGLIKSFGLSCLDLCGYLSDAGNMPVVASATTKPVWSSVPRVMQFLDSEEF